MKYNKNNPLRLATLCSGYESQGLAMLRLKEIYPDFDFKLVAWSEYDPETPDVPLEKQPAVIAHNALFPEARDLNYGDMTKIDWETFPDHDLLFIRPHVRVYHRQACSMASLKEVVRGRALSGM